MKAPNSKTRIAGTKKPGGNRAFSTTYFVQHCEADYAYL